MYLAKKAMAPLPKKDPTHSHTKLPAVSGVSQITSSLEPPWPPAVRSPQIEGTTQPFICLVLLLLLLLSLVPAAKLNSVFVGFQALLCPLVVLAQPDWH